MPPSISVCIPAIRVNTLSHAIESVIRQTFVNWELIVIGQGPSDLVRQHTADFTSRDPRVRYVHCEIPNLSNARNAAISHADADIIAFVDDDCEADRLWLQSIVDCFLADPTIELVSGSLLPPSGWQTGRFTTCPSKVVEDTVYDTVVSFGSPPVGFGLVGGNFAVRKSLFERIGIFDSNLGAGTRFPAGEDTDFLLRAESAGCRMRSCSLSIVHHTFGVRNGFSNALRHMKNYASGNGALAAKLSLEGDRRGLVWVRIAFAEGLTDWIPQRNPARLAQGIVRLVFFVRSYLTCRISFRVADNLLVRKTANPQP